ncbi:glycerophosphodiester phosphodiesterase GDPDL7 [Daucus carota subsp. sativus]|uniref:glycerophosphodiester phosphodiesterase GDPDL7 n=1 Tax=Daucus carota subsp. sativus TaxID=79200 RepID=UPI0007EF050F|nr:PREDICTED: glycerophosphodiester phosphodiesterase GDPDL7 isoform X2 [Daucus carota subsp. sativus]
MTNQVPGIMSRQLCFVSLLLLAGLAAARNNPNSGHHKHGPQDGHVHAPPSVNKKFLTLSGGPPVVVARGGYSGLFPDSSDQAYSFAPMTSLPDTIMYCNVQLTKDNLGVCTTDILIDLSTTAALAYPKGDKTYNINGRDLHGWFAMDYMLDDLKNTTFYVQNVFSRSSAFDGMAQILTPDDLAEIAATGKNRMWLNFDNDMFYAQHKLDAAKYIQESGKLWTPSHISSSELDFLKSLSTKVDKTKTKLVFKFLGKEDVEPTSRQKYGQIDLATLKPFVAGIVVPKDYIFPITKDNYTDAPTTLVADAHRLGLEVYASGFSNDMVASYNYSYDPVNEYLQFIDNSQFSIDGVLTDFPSTASNSIACFSQSKNITTKTTKGLVISHNGASGDFPGCTDLAYQKAIDAGADIIDCNVQMSKDGIAFCSSNIDLTGTTTAVTSFMDRSSNIPEIQPTNGIFSFDLTWSEVESLKPTIEVPIKDGSLLRNPRNKNKGKFLTLDAFLELAKTRKTGGVMIKIRNAAYLASKKGLGVIDAVNTALQKAGLDKETTQKVMIQSEDSSVLAAFKSIPTYERVLSIKEAVSDAPPAVVEEIKKNANAVVIDRESIVQTNSGFFTTTFTKVVEEMHAGNLSVYVSRIRNEYLFLSLDYLADPYLELATFASLKVDGLVTDYPATATAYLRNPCSDVNNPATAIAISAISPGNLIKQVDQTALPPALPPSPVLDNEDVVDPPLPPVTKIKNNAAPAQAPKASGATKRVGNFGIVSTVITLFFGMVCFF